MIFRADWFWPVALECVKEFTAVLFQLTCYARLGNYDLFNGPLVLFVTLVIFGFPYLNPHLYSYLELGPRLKDTQEKGGTFGSTVLKIVCVAAGQILGAVAAAFLLKHVVSVYPKLGRSVTDSILYDDSNLTDTGHYSVPGFVYHGMEEHDMNSAYGYVFIDELLTQLTFLVGLMHIKQVVLTEPSSLEGAHPIPLGLILNASLLCAGVTRAFPSAHQAAHISVFMILAGMVDVRIGMLRITGGFTAMLLFLAYYYWNKPKVITSDSGKLHNDESASDPRFEGSQMLILPLNMRSRR